MKTVLVIIFISQFKGLAPETYKDLAYFNNAQDCIGYLRDIRHFQTPNVETTLLAYCKSEAK